MIEREQQLEDILTWSLRAKADGKEPRYTKVFRMEVYHIGKFPPRFLGKLQCKEFKLLWGYGSNPLAKQEFLGKQAADIFLFLCKYRIFFDKAPVTDVT